MTKKKINYIILKYVLQKNNKVNNKKLNYIISNYPNIKNYLESLVVNFHTYKEIIHRILNNEIEQKYCPICNKPLKYYYGHFWQTHCSTKCSSMDKNVQNKLKQTTIKKYGVDHPSKLSTNNFKSNNPQKTKEIHEKTKQTCLEKYGCEYAWNNDKQKQTCLEKYGYENVFKNKEIIDKIKKTKFNKYGEEHFNNREKAKQTCLEKYDVDNYSKTIKFKTNINWDERQIKINKTKQLNNSFHISKQELKSFELLKEKYKNVISQYRSKVYPYNCDFYIPSLDLYIECNYHWTHGGHKYNNTKEDNAILEKWKNKNTKFYDNAIRTWTERDVNKRKIAKENSLYFVEFFSINELINWLNKNGEA